MAFDKPTRNALARMVADCRRLLTNDVREQLQATYGIQPDGTALAVNKLTYLDDHGLEIATALREWLAHQRGRYGGTTSHKRVLPDDARDGLHISEPLGGAADVRGTGASH